MTTKTYESRASARRALNQIGHAALHAFDKLVEEHKGKFVFNLEAAEDIQNDADETAHEKKASAAPAKATRTIHQATEKKSAGKIKTEKPAKAKGPTKAQSLSLEKMIGGNAPKTLLPNAKEILDQHGCPYCGDTQNGCTVDAPPGDDNCPYLFCHMCGTSFHETTGKLRGAKRSIPHTKSSTIESPCFTVWDLADKMTGARRKDVIAKAVEMGVAFYTARTQYQLWLTAKKNDAARR